MNELEGKLHFPGLSADRLLRWLTNAGLAFGAPVRQVDVVFARSLTALIRPRPGTVVARVRQEDPGGASLTVKQRRSHELDREEFEFSIDDANDAQESLKLLGLRELVTVDKIRRSARLNASDATVTCDDVSGLGVFLEFEILTEHEETPGRLGELISGLEAALPERGRRVTKGYDRLLVEAGLGTDMSRSTR